MISLVTGGNGFIGSRLLKLLTHYGHKVKVLARTPNYNYETIICDLEHDKPPLTALKSVDIVFHLAGCAHDLQSNPKTEPAYQKINVDATAKLAELAVKNNVKTFVFVSSVKAGGVTTDNDCLQKLTKEKLGGAYGQSKREAELKLLAIGNASNLRVLIVRPCMVYGPNMKGNLQVMLAAIKKGWFPPLPETQNSRSMIHVDDLACALLLVATSKAANNGIFIATDGRTYSSRYIYESMCYASGKLPYKWSVPKTLFDIVANISLSLRYKIDKLFADECYSASKLQSLGFKAKLSLREMNETIF